MRQLPGSRELAGICLVVAGAVLVLIRALIPGRTLGPFDLLSRFGLNAQAGVQVHNANQADQIFQFVPWMNLTWNQVHSGHLPLWNPYNVLGMPLAFNWQSSAFSLPTLFAYLFPLSFAYTAMVLAKLVIAGTGAYVFCRVLGLSPLPSTFAGLAFELSGPMIDHAGWPHVAVMCWAGWLFAGMVLLLEERRRRLAVSMVALSLAMAVYGGHPESLVVLCLCAVLFVVVYAVARARLGRRALLRPVGYLAAGAAAGFGLAAPLLLPGAQLGVSSVRGHGSAVATFGASQVVNLVAANLQGLDFKSTAYVGVPVLALAVVALKFRWRTPAVPALTVVAAAAVLLTFFSPAAGLLHLLPHGSTIDWGRAVMPLAFALCVLGAYGLQALIDAPGQELLPFLAWTFAALLGLIALIAVGALLGVSANLKQNGSILWWPAAQAALGVIAVVVVIRRERSVSEGDPLLRRGRVALATFLVLVEGIFLLIVGIGFWSVSSTYASKTPGVTELQSVAGANLVGYGSCRAEQSLTSSPQEVGVRPNANILYGLHVMAVYDPIIPDRYFTTWKAITGVRTPPSTLSLGIFCARISDVAQAQLFGVKYVVEQPGSSLPGGTLVATADGEGIYSVPQSGEATLVSQSGKGSPGGPSPDSGAGQFGSPVPVTHPGPSSWRVSVDASSPSVLLLRLSAVPGWNATIDGRPLQLSDWKGTPMLEAKIPAGRHLVVLDYWPAWFTVGIVVACVVFVLLVVWLVLGLRRS